MMLYKMSALNTELHNILENMQTRMKHIADDRNERRRWLRITTLIMFVIILTCNFITYIDSFVGFIDTQSHAISPTRTTVVSILGVISFCLDYFRGEYLLREIESDPKQQEVEIFLNSEIDRMRKCSDRCITSSETSSCVEQYILAQNYEQAKLYKNFLELLIDGKNHKRVIITSMPESDIPSAREETEPVS